MCTHPVCYYRPDTKYIKKADHDHAYHLSYRNLSPQGKGEKQHVAREEDGFFRCCCGQSYHRRRDANNMFKLWKVVYHEKLPQDAHMDHEPNNPTGVLLPTQTAAPQMSATLAEERDTVTVDSQRKSQFLGSRCI